jgi:SAM-dependent methyltransferase
MTSTHRAYFEEMYRETADPWEFETSPYETRKYRITVASLPRTKYRSAFEPGCSVGVLSNLLARRCHSVLATDIIPLALDRAAERLAATPNVRVEHRSIPEEWPAERFDLILLSEIGYYFAESELERIVQLSLGSLDLGGHLVAVHWRGVTDYPLTGDRAHEVIDGMGMLRKVVHHFEDEFRLDIWERSA